MDFKNTKQVANEWGISPRRVQVLCNENRIKGALKISGVWLIPIDASRPEKLKTGPKQNVEMD